MVRDREKYTPWCAGVQPLLSGVVLGIKSAWRWERVAATQLGGLKTHFKFCRDDMSRPPLRLCWQGWQLASFYESNLKVAESSLELTLKCGTVFLHLCFLPDFDFNVYFKKLKLKIKKLYVYTQKLDSKQRAMTINSIHTEKLPDTTLTTVHLSHGLQWWCEAEYECFGDELLVTWS